MCWVAVCGLVAYAVTSIAQGQCTKLRNGNNRDSQTIDSNTSVNNTTITEFPTKIVTTNHRNCNNPKTANEVKAPYNHNNPSNSQ